MTYGTWMLCGHCARPVSVGIAIGSGIFHEECTHGPGWQQSHFVAPSLTEEEIRRIIREELQREGKHG